jgi:hypothetical protein
VIFEMKYVTCYAGVFFAVFHCFSFTGSGAARCIAESPAMA